MQYQVNPFSALKISFLINMHEIVFGYMISEVFNVDKKMFLLIMKMQIWNFIWHKAIITEYLLRTKLIILEIFCKIKMFIINVWVVPRMQYIQGGAEKYLAWTKMGPERNSNVCSFCQILRRRSGWAISRFRTLPADKSCWCKLWGHS